MGSTTYRITRSVLIVNRMNTKPTHLHDEHLEPEPAEALPANIANNLDRDVFLPFQNRTCSSSAHRSDSRREATCRRIRTRFHPCGCRRRRRCPAVAAGAYITLLTRPLVQINTTTTRMMSVSVEAETPLPDFGEGSRAQNFPDRYVVCIYFHLCDIIKYCTECRKHWTKRAQ